MELGFRGQSTSCWHKRNRPGNGTSVKEPPHLSCPQQPLQIARYLDQSYRNKGILASPITASLDGGPTGSGVMIGLCYGPQPRLHLLQQHLIKGICRKAGQILARHRQGVCLFCSCASHSYDEGVYRASNSAKGKCHRKQTMWWDLWKGLIKLLAHVRSRRGQSVFLRPVPLRRNAIRTIPRSPVYLCFIEFGCVK